MIVTNLSHEIRISPLKKINNRVFSERSPIPGCTRRYDCKASTLLSERSRRTACGALILSRGVIHTRFIQTSKFFDWMIRLKCVSKISTLKPILFQELQVLPDGPQPGLTFQVQSIISSRTRNGVKEYYCSFLHYPRSMNRWIKENDLIK